MTNHMTPDHPAMTNHMTPGLLGWEAAGEYLGCTPRYVRELWARGQLAGVRVGRLVRFERAGLDDFIAANRVPAAR